MGRAPAAGLVTAEHDANVLLGTALRAAAAAGDLLAEAFAGPREVLKTKSTATDVVTEADVAAEAAIRAVLAAERPADAVLGEEGGGGEVPAGGLRWVVDPLDGTVNFLYGVPQWCVSIAVEDGDGAIAGVVLDPMRGETFCAVRGGGAWLGEPGNGQRLGGSDCEDPALALLVTGFAYDADVRVRQADVVARLLPRVRDIRRFGAAALDLAWTAAGRGDVFLERDLKPWDRAAGVLCCAEAGLDVVELGAGEGLPAGVLVGPAALTAALAPLVA